MTVTRLTCELRAEITGDRLAGHAAVFDQLADLPGHYEALATGAFDAVLADDDTDARALVDHQTHMVLGRQSAGTLRLSVDKRGLAFEVDLPETSYARDLRALVDRGDITGASFGFVPGDDEWSKAPDGRALRTHTRVARLFDVSPVTFPAYQGAGVALRKITFGRAAVVRSQLIRARARVHQGERK